MKIYERRKQIVNLLFVILFLPFMVMHIQTPTQRNVWEQQLQTSITDTNLYYSSARNVLCNVTERVLHYPQKCLMFLEWNFLLVNQLRKLGNYFLTNHM